LLCGAHILLKHGRASRKKKGRRVPIVNLQGTGETLAKTGPSPVIAAEFPYALKKEGGKKEKKRKKSAGGSPFIMKPS